MAMGFILAIAAHRKVALVGEGGEEVESVLVFGERHFGPVFTDKCGPLGRCFGGEGNFHRLEARRNVGKPDIIPVLGSEFGFGHAPRRTTNGSDTKALAFGPWTTQPDYA